MSELNPHGQKESHSVTLLSSKGHCKTTSTAGCTMEGAQRMPRCPAGTGQAARVAGDLPHYPHPERWHCAEGPGHVRASLLACLDGQTQLSGKGSPSITLTSFLHAFSSPPRPVSAGTHCRGAAAEAVSETAQEKKRGMKASSAKPSLPSHATLSP